MQTMLAKVERNESHLRTLRETLRKLRAEGVFKKEQCDKELRNQEDVASAAEEHGNVLRTELRFRAKALAKTVMQLEEFGKETASQQQLHEQVTELQRRVELRKKLTRVMNTIDFDVGITPLLVETARAFPECAESQAEALAAMQHTLFWDSVGKQKGRAQHTLQGEVGPLMQAAMERHPFNLHIQIVSCRMLWRTASFFPHLVGGFRTSGCVMTILAGLRRFHKHKRYLYNASGALKALVPMSERVLKYQPSENAIRDPLRVLTSEYEEVVDTGNLADRTRGFKRHLESHMEWLKSGVPRPAPDAITASTGERGSRAKTPGKGAHRRSSMPGQVDRLDVQPSSEPPGETEEQRAVRLAKRTLSGGFGTVTKKAKPRNKSRVAATADSTKGSTARGNASPSRKTRRSGKSPSVTSKARRRSVSPIRQPRRTSPHKATSMLRRAARETTKSVAKKLVAIRDAKRHLVPRTMALRPVPEAEAEFWGRDCLPRLLACLDSFPKVTCFVESALVALTIAIEERPWRALYLLAADLLPILMNCLQQHLTRPVVQACGLFLMLKAIPYKAPYRAKVLAKYQEIEFVEHLLRVTVVFAQSRDLPPPSRRHSLPNKTLAPPRPTSSGTASRAASPQRRSPSGRRHRRSVVIGAEGLRDQERAWDDEKWQVMAPIMHPSRMMLRELPAADTTLRVLNGPAPPATPDPKRRGRQRAAFSGSDTKEGSAAWRREHTDRATYEPMSEQALADLVVRLADAAMAIYSGPIKNKSRQTRQIMSPSEARRRRRRLRRGASQRQRSQRQRALPPQTGDEEAPAVSLSIDVSMSTTTVPIVRQGQGGEALSLPDVTTPSAAAVSGATAAAGGQLGPALRKGATPLQRSNTARSVNFDVLPDVVHRSSNSGRTRERGGSSRGSARLVMSPMGRAGGGLFGGSRPSTADSGVSTGSEVSEGLLGRVPGMRLGSAKYNARRASVDRRQLASVLGTSPRSWSPSASESDGSHAGSGDDNGGQQGVRSAAPGDVAVTGFARNWSTSDVGLLSATGSAVSLLSGGAGAANGGAAAGRRRRDFFSGGGAATPGGGFQGLGDAEVLEAGPRASLPSPLPPHGAETNAAAEVAVHEEDSDPLRAFVGHKAKLRVNTSLQADTQALPTSHTAISLFSDTTEDFARFASEPQTPVGDDGAPARTGTRW